jgi:hypothetical protein
MRTTLSLDDDVLAAAKAIAEARGETLGAAVSRLVRERLAVAYGSTERSGVPLLPSRADGAMVTPDLVRDLLEAE